MKKISCVPAVLFALKSKEHHISRSLSLVINYCHLIGPSVIEYHESESSVGYLFLDEQQVLVLMDTN